MDLSQIKQPIEYNCVYYCGCSIQSAANPMIYDACTCRQSREPRELPTPPQHDVYYLTQQPKRRNQDVISTSAPRSDRRIPTTPRPSVAVSTEDDGRLGRLGSQPIEVDAYGRPMSTAVDGELVGSETEYDERWYGVRKHVHDDVMVAAGESGNRGGVEDWGWGGGQRIS